MRRCGAGVGNSTCRSGVVPGWWALALAVAWWGCLVAASAHPAFLTSAELVIAPDGSFHGRADFDTLAFALNDTSSRIGNEPMEQLMIGPREALEAQLADARGRFLHGFQVTTDAGTGVVDSLEFPGADQILQWRDTRRPVLPVVIPVTMKGHLPGGTHRLTVRFPAVLEQVVLSVERPGEEPFLQPVEAGTESTPLPVQLVALPGTKIASGKMGTGVKPLTASAELEKTAGRWRMDTRFPVVLGGVILLSFAGAFGWSKLTART